MTKTKSIISLCDYTGLFCDPWRATHRVYQYDMQLDGRKIEDCLQEIGRIIKDTDVQFVSAFPPCTDLAVSGAAHFASKREKDPRFQEKALELFKLCEYIGKISGAPYFIENPVSVVSTMYRKPDFSFHPWEYGGYLPEDDINPISDIIPPRDAYPKKTCLWTGNGFSPPDKKPISCPKGFSPQHRLLGGKSLKAKNIRSATPRGFAIACATAYKN